MFKKFIWFFAMFLLVIPFVSATTTKYFFNSTGFNQTFVIPVTTSNVYFLMWGGGGAGGDGAGPGLNHGGAGGFTNCTINFTVGETIVLTVGQGGNGTGNIDRPLAGGGGGRSQIARQSDDELLAIAGGGGGSGGAQGGAGGGTKGLSGSGGIGDTPGSGGTQTAGGAGSFAGGSLFGGNSSAVATDNRAFGGFPNGGTGYHQGGAAVGGGGGDGYFGGGGGIDPSGGDGGAGGGGSGYIGGCNIGSETLATTAVNSQTPPKTGDADFITMNNTNRIGIGYGNSDRNDYGGNGTIIAVVEISAADTTPPEIKFYNITSEGGLGCTNWNTNKQNSCKTSDKTPTVKINLSEPSFCAISTLNLNYTDMIANDPLTNCTNAPGNILTCTLPDTKEFTSPGLYNISIGCKDEAGNQNRSSTSGNLTINLTDVAQPTVTLEKPDNNAVLFFKDRPFRFNFTATDDFGLLNMSCRLYFNNTLKQTNSSVKNGTLTNWILVNISRNVWQWNVTCTDNSSNTGSSARIVTINNTKPTAPTLQTPANNSGFGNQPSNLPEFNWNNSVDDDGIDTITYTIEVNNQSDFNGNRVYFNSSVPQDSDRVTGVNVTLPSNDEDTYFWRVRANDGFGNSSFSKTFQFAYANWTITFNLTDSVTNKTLTFSGSQRMSVTCGGFSTRQTKTNPFPATNTFAPDDYTCQYTADLHYGKTDSFIADSNKMVVVPMSLIGKGLTTEEHNWLQFLYNCFNSGECIDLLRTINQTTKDIWKRVTGTDTSVILFENITTNTLSATSNISIDYTINIPVKEGYAVGALLPLRMFFWITDVNKTKCFNQDKATDTNRAEAPYCLPLVAETLGPNGGQVNFTVDLRPNIPNGDYNITRSIEIDPIINNAVRWVNYGQDNIGQIQVLESGNAASHLIKTGESIPEKSIKELTDITGASFITIKLTSKAVKIILIILSVITITLFGYIIYSKKKDKKLN